MGWRKDLTSAEDFRLIVLSKRLRAARKGLALRGKAQMFSRKDLTFVGGPRASR